MTYQYGCNVITERKEEMRSSSALALAVALALAFPGSAAMAINNPIPGVDIIVKKHPGGIAVITPIDASGKFSVRLESGQYSFSAACRQPGCEPYAVSIIAADAPRKSGADGTLNFNVTVSSTPVTLRGQIQSTACAAGYCASGEHIKNGTLTMGAAPTPTGGSEILPGTMAEPIYGQPVILTAKIAENESPRPSDAVARVTGIVVDPRDASLDIMVRESPAKASGDGKLPSKGFEKTFFDARASTRVTIDWGDGTTSKMNAPTSTGGDGKLPSIAGVPISGIPVALDQDPGGEQVSKTTTDAAGSFNFNKLPPGKYKLTIASQPSQSVSVGAGGIISGNVMSSNSGESSGTLVYRITNVRLNAKNVNAGEASANWGRWENGVLPANAALPTVVTGEGVDNFDRLLNGANLGSPSVPGTFGGVGSNAGFGAMAPGAMGHGAGSPMHP